MSGFLPRRPSWKAGDFLHNALATKSYGPIGYFRLDHPRTSRYRYANWGSRPYEYAYVARRLDQIGVRDRDVLDVGIGLPSDSDFYTYYLEAGCRLTGVDPDGRLAPVTELSARCRILRCSAEEIPLDDDSVDVAVALSSLEHFPLPAFERSLEEVARVLRPSGVFVVTLDLTYRKPESARWAVLEKTLYGLPPEENDLPLPDGEEGLTLERFLRLASCCFETPEAEIANAGLPIAGRVHSEVYNSMPGYIELRPGTR